MPLILLMLLLPATSSAQSIREWQTHAIGTVAAERFLGGGVGFALRPPGRLGWALTASGGDLEGSLALRLETLVSFHLSPERPSGAAPYAAAGVAANVARGDARGYVLFLVGIESRPGGRSGWFAEVGVGGGVRLATGFRLRQRRPGR